MLTASPLQNRSSSSPRWSAVASQSWHSLKRRLASHSTYSSELLLLFGALAFHFSVMPSNHQGQQRAQRERTGAPPSQPSPSPGTTASGPTPAHRTDREILRP